MGFRTAQTSGGEGLDLDGVLPLALPELNNEKTAKKNKFAAVFMIG